ncbi:dolichyl-phosphate beta-D-mannosyltransferase [Hyphomicrobium denitrificans 1NES1]|uniref:Dolichyl-phosphate beta-D-mannosyltransferase n=1 Tax=Hyphomicrobium denitrificans 1NES1 TaxID=670307 RepID=N0B7Y8_9HYPH|nr:glycosyltransferase family 2 protein [Hyphomicrobium denitrificans]AGK58367.1 dolichyl-phosphate beta-D-mannosyltransferase [Hyphomicrobium denitrificans 1NES1]
MTPRPRPDTFSTTDVRGPTHDAPVGRPRLSIVVPTYCEAENVAPTITAIDAALTGISWEIIFVDDDSPDGTVETVRSFGEHDGRVRVIRRIGRRGLAGAVIEGMLASAADTVAVIDADLQHDEKLLPKMLENIEADQADLVIATRYAQSGAADAGFSKLRQNASTFATRLTNLLLRTNVSDPMSGFFMIRRDAIDKIAPNLTTGGFKLLLDILASAPAGLKIAEVPYQFRPRQLGKSKLDALVIADFLGLLLSKLSGNSISPRFFLFAFVGATGLVVHLATLRAALTTTHIPFNAAQLAAAFVAMTSNFFLNNALTFRDRRLTGIGAFKGLLSFYLVCSVGTLANVGVAELIYLRDASWWRAGIAGALMAAVFNYAVSSMLTWRK